MQVSFEGLTSPLSGLRHSIRITIVRGRLQDILFYALIYAGESKRRKILKPRAND